MAERDVASLSARPECYRAAAMSKGTRKKIGLFVGVGGAALAILCCGGMALGFHGPRSRHLAKAVRVLVGPRR